MAEAIPDDRGDLVDQFRHALEDCEELYRGCAVECADARPDLTGEKRSEFFHRMLDLQRGLVLKIFVAVAYVDRRWTAEELVLARVLLAHVWHRRLNDKQIRVALAHCMDQTGLTWDVLLGPFERLREFRRRTAELKTVVLRLANLVAKVDGRVAPEEVEQLQWIRAELQRVLDRVPLYTPDPNESVPAAGRAALKEAALVTSPFQEPAAVPERSAAVPAAAPASLADSSAELDALIGLTTIKQEVRSLVNLLKMQRARKEFDLPQTTITLHSVFRGNPGTGKTSVARLLAQIFRALGMLARGHLIETDRSGLVAEYAGQTAPKAHKKIDEALDGVLFIDEAYSLVAERGDDPYGLEAIQVLLKRMEDNRDRLIVILAGYPAPMDRLLKSNPGLSSRFSRMFDFPDYSAAELGSIFESLCRKNHYTVSVLTRVKLLLGFQHLLAHRDEHFGNGRLVRNGFEHAIGRLADRIAGVAPLTREILTTLQPGDIEMEGVPAVVWKELDSPNRVFQVICPGCRQLRRVPQKLLGQKVHCTKCAQRFEAGWGEVLAQAAAGAEASSGSPLCE